MESNYWTRVLTQRTMKRRKALGLAASGLTGAALLAACGDDDGATGGGTSAPAATTAPGAPAATADTSVSEDTPQPGGRFASTTRAQENLDVVHNWSEGFTLSGIHTYDRPITAREDERRFVLEAMETLEQPDDLTVIMKLKPGQTFHDLAPVNGRPLVAADIVATQEYIRDAEDAFDKTFQRDFLELAEAPDDLTVIYHLKKPTAYLYAENILGAGSGQPIVPQETFANLKDSKQIGSGPYITEKADLGIGYLYKKNPKFREQGLPYIEEREVKVITDSIAKEAAFRAGQVDVWTGLTSTQAEQVPADMGDKATFLRRPQFGGRAWQLNMTKTEMPWRDVRVREALWRLTDRQQMLDLAEGGEGTIGTGLMPVSLTEYLLDAKDTDAFYVQDIEKAKQLLSAANFDFDREYPLFTSSSETWRASGQVWANQLQKSGMKVRVDSNPAYQLFVVWAQNDWFFQISNPPGDNTPSNYMRIQHSDSWSDVYHNFALMDPEIDALIEKAEVTIDAAENTKLVKEIQLECIKKFTSCYIVHTPNDLRILSSRVQNYELSLVRALYRHEMWLKD